MTDARTEDDFFAFLESGRGKAAADLGAATAKHEMILMAQKAYDMGEIELFLEAMRAKSIEEWGEWEDAHGKNFSDRWKPE